MKLYLFALFILHAKAFANEDNDPTTPASHNNTEQRVDVAANSLFDEFWQMRLRVYPIFATAIGDHRYDDRFTCYSLKCYENRKVMMTEFMERATQLLPLAAEDSDTHNDIQFFILILQYWIDQITSRSHLFPYSIMFTPQKSLRLLLMYTKFENATSYWNLLSRYRAFPKTVDEQIELMREGIRTNFTLHETSLWKHGEYENISVSDSPFYEPFLNIPSTVSAQEIADIQANASDAVMNYLYPALKKLDDFMEEEYRPNTRSDVGVGSLPNGREYYRHALAYDLTDSKATAEEIHAMGVSEVHRIAQEMEEVIRSLGLNMTMLEFSDNLRNDKAQFFSSKEEALETYRHIIKDVISPKLPLLFNNIPEKILTVEGVPEDISSGPLAYYVQPLPDNSTPGIFFLDVTSPENLPRYDVVTLAMHEGVPGHHFQISYAMERDDVPDFRKYGSNSNAFTEGWAMYAEYLGYELGLYDDPYMRYGHLSEEILEACRLVVDTGMHVFGWSRQRAIDYMMNYTASTLHNIEREVDRYIAWPGQACAYTYGLLKIKEFRRRAEAALGEAFDIKEFHDVILRNSGPLELVEKQVDRYIAKTNNTVLDS